MERPVSWDDYERAVMAGRAEEVDAPGDDYVMNDDFREWLVERMRDEVLGNVGMAVLKEKMSPGAEATPTADDDQTT